MMFVLFLFMYQMVRHDSLFFFSLFASMRTALNRHHRTVQLIVHRSNLFIAFFALFLIHL